MWLLALACSSPQTCPLLQHTILLALSVTGRVCTQQKWRWRSAWLFLLPSVHSTLRMHARQLKHSCWCRAIREETEMSQRNRQIGRNRRPCRCQPCERLIRRCANAGHSSEWVRARLLDDTMHTYSTFFDNVSVGKPITRAMATASGSPCLQLVSAPIASAAVADGENGDSERHEQQVLRLQYSPPATRRAARALNISPRDPSVQRTQSTERSTQPAMMAPTGLERELKPVEGGTSGATVGAGGSRNLSSSRGARRKSTTAAGASTPAAVMPTGALHRSHSHLPVPHPPPLRSTFV